MLNIINKLLNYFGYKLLLVGEIENTNSEIDNLYTTLAEVKNKLLFSNKEKDRLINLVADKDKTILAHEHQIDNQRVLIEEDKQTIQGLNEQSIQLGDKIARLDSDIIDLQTQLKQRITDMNRLRSALTRSYDSRDHWKNKYKQLVGKLALDKCCNKK